MFGGYGNTPTSVQCLRYGIGFYYVMLLVLYRRVLTLFDVDCTTTATAAVFFEAFCRLFFFATGWPSRDAPVARVCETRFICHSLSNKFRNSQLRSVSSSSDSVFFSLFCWRLF